jgi:hypothetical protein
MMRFAAVVVLMILVVGCASKNREPGVAAAESERWRATDEAVVNTLAESVRNPRVHAGSITHVVLLWLKSPGDAAAIDRIVSTSREFTKIPGVMSVRVGRALPSTRPVVDSSFDVGLAMTFNDAAALQAYEVHPQHVKAVREVLRPLAARIQVYDITEADMKAAGAATAPASK